MIARWKSVVSSSTVLLTMLVTCWNPTARAAPDQSEAALRKASQIIKTHRLLSAKDQACVTLVFNSITKGVADVGVYERHDKTCGGDPETSPRRFDLEINMKTGAAKWDDNVDRTMQALPR